MIDSTLAIASSGHLVIVGLVGWSVGYGRSTVFKNLGLGSRFAGRSGPGPRSRGLESPVELASDAVR